MAFLAVALALHAILLLVPISQSLGEKPASTPRLTLDLRLAAPDVPDMAPMPDRPESELSKPEPQAEQAPVMEPVERRSSQIALAELPELPIDTSSAEPSPAPEMLTAQQLRDLARFSQDRESAPGSTRRLGDAKPYQPPANWNRNAGAPYLAEFENRFNEMVAPEEVEIVDRWLAADGSHNVVLNLPNGETLCGRAEAYNPMQPLVDPIMMFRKCGSGGKRSFTMPDRYNKGQ